MLPTPGALEAKERREGRRRAAKAAGARIAGADLALADAAPAPADGSGLVDTLGRFYGGKPSGPVPRPPEPIFRTEGARRAAELRKEQRALAARPVTAAPKLETIDDVVAAIRAVASQVMAGELSGIEGFRRTKSLQSLLDAMGIAKLQRRLDRIEHALASRGSR